jgi:tetratricopeptide (TPR) repeat protein
MLYMGASSLDSASYVALVNEVIEKYPKAPDGYQYRAPLHLSAHNFDAAQRDMEQAISLAEKKDEAHFSFSRLILQKELYMKAYPYEPWSLDKAMDEAEKAYAINPMPVYQQQQALVLFAQKKYEEAADKYLALTKTDLRSPELFYEASRCKELLNDTTAQLAMLDSAVAMFNRPLLKEAAPYLLARAQIRLNLKHYRDAVFDMNDYESLMRNQLNANFYYLRYQADMGGRLYQQALNDINRAIEIDEKEMFYRAEKASLLIRVGHFEEAIETARELIKLEPNQSDGYLFLGLALCLDNKKAEGLQQLQKALDMGDPQAAGFIEKYGK